MARHDGRKPTELRKLEIVRGYTQNAAGSVLIRAGNTIVLCTACWESSVPPWKKGQGSGWVTAEYSMLPRSGRQRNQRAAAPENEIVTVNPDHWFAKGNHNLINAAGP